MSPGLRPRVDRELVRDPASGRYFAELVAAARAGAKPLLSVERMRTAALAFAEGPLAHVVPAEIERENVALPCGVNAAWFRPKHAKRAAPLLYLHGGGYVCGSIDAARGLAGQLAQAFNAPLLAVGYAQAPEHPIPAALVDAHTAYAWLTTQTDEAITLIGDSAGGQLAVATAVLATKAGLRRPWAAIAISAWFDLAMKTPSWTANRKKDFSTIELGRLFRAAYLAGRPIAAASIPEAGLALLPPLMVVMGGAELAIDDADAFVARVRAAGVKVAYEVFEDLPHNFVRYTSKASSTALMRMAAWEKALG